MLCIYVVIDCFHIPVGQIDEECAMIWNRQLQYTVTFVLAEHMLACCHLELSLSVYKKLYTSYKKSVLY